jgi:KaiC/GvpD/RAD55 family RecA-like ATPase
MPTDSSEVPCIETGNLPYVASLFEPRGIPLLLKFHAAHTTCVLVQGTAGVGKSTLALAIARSIATACDGIVLYVATEASLTDVAFKAMSLGVQKGIFSYETDGDYDTGDVMVKHAVVALKEDQLTDETTTTELLHKTLAFTHQLIQQHPPTSKPIRAVVIDCMPLPEKDGPLPRLELIGFIHNVESFGVSPIFVEEVRAGATDTATTFLVDVVFQLGWFTEPGTGKLVRKLTIPKSRYAASSPGPHTIVLEDHQLKIR